MQNASHTAVLVSGSNPGLDQVNTLCDGVATINKPSSPTVLFGLVFEIKASRKALKVAVNVSCLTLWSSINVKFSSKLSSVVFSSACSGAVDRAFF
jgi:hypothetical protein